MKLFSPPNQSFLDDSSFVSGTVPVTHAGVTVPVRALASNLPNR